MPRKAKEKDESIEIKTKNKNTTTKSKKPSTKTKKEISPKTKTEKDSATKTKSTTKNKKTSAKTKKASATKAKKIITTEYYDLPYNYNQTIVKILAQTPKTLYIYWEISDSDIKKYKEIYGENFFETTKPILIIHNDTLHYSFEIEINDFANSWYLHVNDENSKYIIELARRPITNNSSKINDYISITSSNNIKSPNDHILFNTDQKMVFFKNIKTSQTIEKQISNIFFIKSIGKIYNIYDMYKNLYKNEDDFNSLLNPSSKFK